MNYVQWKNVIAGALLAMISFVPVAGKAQVSTEKLIKALLEDDSEKVRLQAAVYLGRSQDEKAVKPLLQALNDHHYAVRSAVAMALANLEYDLVIPRIIRMAAKDEEEFVRVEARRALRKFDRDVARKYTISSYSSSNYRIRLESVRYLAELPDAQSIPTLVKALGDEPQVYSLSRVAIMAMGEARALEVLRPVILQDPVRFSPRIRVGVIKVLRDIGTQKAANLLRQVYVSEVEDPNVVAHAGQALQELRRHLPLSQLVEQARNGEDRGARVDAIKLLGIIAEEQAFSTLISLLDDEDTYIKGRAVLALKDFGDARAVEHLKKLQDKPGLQRIQSIIKNAIDALAIQEGPLR